MAKSSNAKKSPVKKKSSPKDSPSPAFAPTDSKIAATSSTDDTGLSKLFLDAIKDIYWAENNLVKSLPKLIDAASSPELQSALNDHLQVTEGHVSRLEKIFESLGKKPQAKKCDAMEGLAKEAEGIIENTDSGTLSRDQGIIMAAQKTEHYEIATYSGLANLAKALGYNDIFPLLEQTLAEEQEADETLTALAEDGLTNTGNSPK